jgi:hypothetical protein
MAQVVAVAQLLSDQMEVRVVMLWVVMVAKDIH